MEDLLKELDTLERLTSLEPSSGTRKGKTAPVSDLLDSLLEALEQAKASLNIGVSPEDVAAEISRRVEECKKAVDERQKEGNTAYTKFSKSVDKVFSQGLSSIPMPFSSNESRQAIDTAVANHLIRKGDFEIADTFLKDSGIQIPASTSIHFKQLHGILFALRNRDVQPALSWAMENRSFLLGRKSPLEFLLHRFQYLRLLFASDPPDLGPVLQYARDYFTSIYDSHPVEIKGLMNAVLFLPFARLLESPYAELASTASDAELEPLFSKEFCARLGLPLEPPLDVIADLGGGAAVSTVEVQKKKIARVGTEWRADTEFPTELPVPRRHRYHTLIVCPVLKIPTSDANPPMMLPCGHIMSRDALTRYSKGPGRTKCYTCPTECAPQNIIQLYF